MSMRGPEICDCSCHEFPDKKHIVACCDICPHCRQNIYRFFIEEHVKRCKEEREELKKAFVIK